MEMTDDLFGRLSEDIGDDGRLFWWLSDEKDYKSWKDIDGDW
jgi:hypothetical protein